MLPTQFAPLPAGPFGCIVADPPWLYSYSTRRSEIPGTGWHGAVERHYRTLTFAQIASLPVGDLAAEDAVLWLWVVNPMLERCLAVMQAWGFSYRGLLTWAKVARKPPTRPFIGMGYWLRGATEHVALGVRGKPTRLRRNVPSWFAAPPAEHSRKPSEARQIFESYSPGPRLELFARGTAPGWASWGLEAAPAAKATP